MPLFSFYRLGMEMGWQWGPDPPRNESAQFLILHVRIRYLPAFREKALYSLLRHNELCIAL